MQSVNIQTIEQIYQSVFALKKNELKTLLLEMFLKATSALELGIGRRFLNENAKHEEIFLTYETLAGTHESKTRKNKVPLKVKNAEKKLVEQKDDKGNVVMVDKAVKLKDPITIGVNFTKVLQYIYASLLHDAQVYMASCPTTNDKVLDAFKEYLHKSTKGISRFIMLSYTNKDYDNMNRYVVNKMTPHLELIGAVVTSIPQDLRSEIAKKFFLFLIKLSLKYANKLNATVSIAEISKKELTDEEKKTRAEKKKNAAAATAAAAAPAVVDSKEAKAVDAPKAPKKVTNPDEKAVKADPNDIINLVKDELTRLDPEFIFDIKDFAVSVIAFIKAEKKAHATTGKRGTHKEKPADTAAAKAAVADATTVGVNLAAKQVAAQQAATTAPTNIPAALPIANAIPTGILNLVDANTQVTVIPRGKTRLPDE